MNLVSDEMLMAYADGELLPDEQVALDARLAQDASLRARLEPFVQTRTQLAALFEPTIHEPIPDRLIATIQRAPRTRRPSLGDRLRDMLDAAAATVFPNGLTPVAMAASVVTLLTAGAAAGWLASSALKPSNFIEVAGSELVASGALARALETGPSGTVWKADGASVTPVMSFQTKTNGVCREYRIAAKSGPSFAGLACRTADGDWRLAQHVETPKQSAAEGYQTATGASVPAIDTLVDTMISGAAFGKGDEAARLKHGWLNSPSK